MGSPSGSPKDEDRDYDLDAGPSGGAAPSPPVDYEGYSLDLGAESSYLSKTDHLAEAYLDWDTNDGPSEFDLFGFVDEDSRKIRDESPQESKFKFLEKWPYTLDAANTFRDEGSKRRRRISDDTLGQKVSQKSSPHMHETSTLQSPNSSRKRHLPQDISFSSYIDDRDLESKSDKSLYQGAKNSRTDRLTWTLAEELRLKTMRDAGNSWAEIGKAFPHRTLGNIQVHWETKMHHAEFNEEEGAALIDAIKEYENVKWEFVSATVGKSAYACAQYAKEHLGANPATVSSTVPETRFKNRGNTDDALEREGSHPIPGLIKHPDSWSMQQLTDYFMRSSTIKFHFEFPMALKELVERCKSPEEGRDRLMNHVVLIKSYSAASGVQQNAAIRATTCGEHMEKRWPSIGLRLLSDISVVLFKGDFENTYRRVHHSYDMNIKLESANKTIIVVEIKDGFSTRPEVKDCLHCLDWLFRAIREPSDGFLISQSSCRWSTSPSVVQDMPLSFTLQSTPLPEMDHNCWQHLFGSCFVLEETDCHSGEPPPGKGLETSFHLMLAMAGVEYPVEVDGGVVFVGYNTVLVPTKVEHDYAQFHLEVDSEQQINPFTLNYTDRVLITDYTVLKSKRCFLGWCELAHIKLGTRALPPTVQYSSAKEKKKTVHLSSLSTGFQLTSAAPVQAGINGQANFSFLSHRLHFPAPTIYSKMIWDTSKHVALVCDVAAQRSWLVPKLSLMVHMAHAWFYSQHPEQEGSVEENPIPFVEPYLRGATLAQCFDKQGDVIVCGSGNDAFRLRSLLLGLNINLLETKRLTEKSNNQCLYGYEFMDIVSEPGKGSVMKEAKMKKSKNWLGLANLVDAVVFCSDLGDAISPAHLGSRKSSSCNLLPVGHEYLAAHVSCLAELAKRSGHPLGTRLTSSQIVLSEKNVWHFSGEPFEPCNHEESNDDDCWHRPDILQQVYTKEGWAFARYVGFERSAISLGIAETKKNGKRKRNEECETAMRRDSLISWAGAVVFGESLDSG